MRQSVQQIRMLVLGATGATGRHLVVAARRRGHEVVTLVRRSGAFDDDPGVEERLWEGPADTAALAGALHGTDVVVSALGGAASGPTTVCTDAVRTLVPLMEASGPDRLVVVSAHGVLETHDRSLFVRAAWANVAARLRDKESMEPLITSSSLRWTIVRPPALRDRAPRGRYRAGSDLPVRLWSSVSREDLATFILDEAQASDFVGSYPRVLS